MKVLLIAPPLRLNPPFELSVVYYPPRSLMVLAAIARQYGHDVKILDMPILGLGFDTVSAHIRKYSPQVIGIPTHASPDVPKVRRLIEIVKKINPSIPIITGGAIPTFVKEEIFSIIPGIDIAVIGEGEATFPEVLNALEAKQELNSVRGIIFRRNGETIVTPEQKLINLDDIPVVAHDLLPMELYVEKGCEYPLEAQRGCPFSCNFCASNFPGWRGNIRRRSVSLVVDEIEEVAKKYHYQKMWFMDETLTLNRKAILSLSNEIKKRELNYLKWGGLTRVDCVDRELLQNMKEAGCVSLGYGIESASQNSLDNSSKNVTLEQCEEAIKITQEIGIRCALYFILGFPTDRHEDFLNIFKFIDKCGDPQIQAFIFHPLPGSSFWEEFKKDYLSWISKDGISYLGTDEEWLNLNVLEKPVVNGNLSLEDIIKYVIKINYGFPSRYDEVKDEVFIRKILNKEIPIINPHLTYLSISSQVGGYCYIPDLKEEDNFDDIYRNVYALNPIYYEVLLRCAGGFSIQEIVDYIAILFDKDKETATGMVIKILGEFVENGIITGVDLKKFSTKRDNHLTA